MATGLGKVARQFGVYGTYAIVHVETTPRIQSFSIKIDPSVSDAESGFLAAVEVGIRYAWEHLDHHARPPGVEVRVTDLQVMVSDTTQMTVVYAAALALWDALKLSPERPVELLPESRSLRFPV